METNDTSGFYHYDDVGVEAGNYYNISLEVTASDGVSKLFLWEKETFWTYPEKARVVVFAVNFQSTVVQWHEPGVNKEVNKDKTTVLM